MVRFKNRYLLAEVLWEKSSAHAKKQPTRLSREELANAIKESVRQNFGDFGVGAIYSAFQIKYFNDKTWMCIIRCARDHYKILWAGITLLTQLNGEPAIVRILHVGGTIKSCQLHAIEHNKNVMRLMQAKAMSGAARAEVEAMQVDTAILEVAEDITDV